MPEYRVTVDQGGGRTDYATQLIIDAPYRHDVLCDPTVRLAVAGMVMADRAVTVTVEQVG